MTKIKTLLRNFPVFVGAVGLSLLCIILTFFTASKWLAIAELVILAAVLVLVFVYFDVFNARKQKLLSQISSNLDFMGSSTSNDFPLPISVCKPDGTIIWYNNLFEDQVIGSNPSGYSELTAVFNNVGMDTILNSAGTGVLIDCDDKYFTVYSHKAQKDNEDVVVLYFVDTTKYRKIADEYVKTRPAIAIMTIDNMAELQQDYRESDCAAIRNGIEKLAEMWISEYSCFISKVSDSKFYIVAEKQDLDDMISRRFDILDDVREYTYDNKYVGVTLSIGVGCGATFPECESNAKLALDMALGRGGDQAVIKFKDKYEFFGGVSKSVESNTKVKSRTVAAAFTELVQGCDNLFVMGHRFPDFDAVGSAIGVVKIAQSLGKKAYIATNKQQSMAKPLIETAEKEGFDGVFLSLDEAKHKMSQNKKNLLVVVDTHITNFVEDPELLEKASMVVVIDHHRKAVDYIKNAVIFFHDPSASSASEMVAELSEYIPAVTQLGSFAADALMAGIMLDTKNFILRVGSKTFEAAAYLKTQGAETVRVKKFFANDIENYHVRNKIISGARKYHNCAIALNDEESADIRMISAQSADELLNISGVDASFVIFKMNNVICVSARSLGAVNVQVIMEYLGGGGHQTMAAAQIKDSDIEHVTADVMRSIDRYNEENNIKK
ncbi:MAG: DHH family phosphoesterase [Clostridia bacterium]|nr:DHH family phosphoesterase [Clostridia bacterium]